MKKILIFLIMIVFCSCDSTEGKDVLGLTYDISTEFSVFNGQNEDLLDPENPNHIDVSKIQLFYMIDGKLQEFNNSHNIRIIKYENEYRMGIILNNYSGPSDKGVIYIQWNENERDKIESTFRLAYNLYRPEKIWFNDNLVWEFNYGISQAHFKIIKE